MFCLCVVSHQYRVWKFVCVSREDGKLAQVGPGPKGGGVLGDDDCRY